MLLMLRCYDVPNELVKYHAKQPLIFENVDEKVAKLSACSKEKTAREVDQTNTLIWVKKKETNNEF